jgi:hypothetical protein
MWESWRPRRVEQALRRASQRMDASVPLLVIPDVDTDDACPKHKQYHSQVEIILKPNPVLPTIGFIVERAKDILEDVQNVLLLIEAI